MPIIPRMLPPCRSVLPPPLGHPLLTSLHIRVSLTRSPSSAEMSSPSHSPPPLARTQTCQAQCFPSSHLQRQLLTQKRGRCDYLLPRYHCPPGQASAHLVPAFLICGFGSCLTAFLSSYLGSRPAHLQCLWILPSRATALGILNVLPSSDLLPLHVTV